MNVFDAIYLNNEDPIERAFIAAETALDIAVERAENEYVYEMGLISLSDNKVFIESEDPKSENESDEKRENTFIKAVKAICTAIRNFITDLVETVAGLFDRRENITAEDYLESPTGKVRLEKDIKQLEATVNDEIRKSNKLLQKISSITHISDETIDNFIQTSKEKVTKLAPVIIPAVVAFGFKQFFKFQDHKKEIDAAEKTAIEGDNSDPSTTKQKTKVLGHMQWLMKQMGSALTDWTKAMNKAKKKSN